MYRVSCLYYASVACTNCVYAIYSDVVPAAAAVVFIRFRYIWWDCSENNFLYMSQCLPSAYYAHTYNTHNTQTHATQIGGKKK